MDEITISGRTVEEAVEAGLDALGAERAEVDIQVVDEGVKGILGLLGTRLARVRLSRKKPEARPSPEPATSAPEVRAVPEAGDSSEGDEAALEERSRPVYRPATELQVERAERFLENVCRLLGVDGEVSAAEVDGATRLRVEGPDMGLLIGRRGQTLDALQYLTGLVANRGAKTPARFVVDVEGYRERREATLRRLARQTAERVKARGHRAVLEPMTPQERRVIHLALAGDPEVFTYSEGEEPYRRVVVALKEDGGGGSGE